MRSLRQHVSDLEFWLLVLSNQAPLSTPDGLSAWHDGLGLLTNLNFSDISNSTDSRSLEFLRCLKAREQRDFDVVGDSLLEFSSPLYKKIQTLAREQSLRYSFVDSEEGRFEPWSNSIELGSKYAGRFNGRATIPFYSFNHENAHAALFGHCYADLELSDERFAEALLLIEWFCISLDLVLAFDLKRHSMTQALSQLDTVSPSRTFFTSNIHSVEDIDLIASRFRETFLSGKRDLFVETLISESTMEKHRSYTREILAPACRERKSVAKDQGRLLDQLTKLPLSEIIRNLLGISLAA